MGMLGLNLPPGQMCVRTLVSGVCVKSVCGYERENREGGRGGGLLYTCLHSKRIAHLRGSVEDVLRFPGVNILQRCRCVSRLMGSVL